MTYDMIRGALKKESFEEDMILLVRFSCTHEGIRSLKCFALIWLFSFLFCCHQRIHGFETAPVLRAHPFVSRREWNQLQRHILSQRSHKIEICRVDGVSLWNTKREAGDENNIQYRKTKDVSTTNKSLIRLNKVFKATHSRREADKLIQSGRVKVNGERVDGNSGFSGVIPYKDVITLDGKKIVGWEKMNALNDKEFSAPISTSKSQINSQRRRGMSKDDNLSVGSLDSIESMSRQFEYIKYWKPSGVICTTDLKIPNNILDEITQVDGYRPKHRVYPVGRLDKDTTGLILLTSDGRIPNAVLRGEYKKNKTYNVYLDRPISEKDMQQLREGVVITTQAQRDGGRSKPLTAATLPAQVERITGARASNGIKMTIVEGRNRQIRKMLEALRYNVIELHRENFMGIDLSPLTGPGGWVPLSRQELSILREALKSSS